MIVDREEILDSLTRLQTCVGKDNLQPMYQSICFKDKFATAYNGEFGAVLRMDIGADCLVHGEKLAAAVSKAPSENIEITCDGSSLQIKSGRSRTSLQVGHPHGFPDIVPRHYESLTHASDLTAAMSTLLRLTDAKAQLSKIVLHRQHALSTDGKRVTRIRLAESVGSGIVSISVSSAKALVSLGQPKSTFATTNQFLALCDKTLFVSSQSDSRVPVNHIHEMADTPVSQGNTKVLPHGFSDSLGRAKLLSRIDAGVLVESTGSTLRVASLGSQAGTFEETFDWEFAKFRISVNPSHFQDAMKFSSHLDFTSVLSSEPRFVRFVLPDQDHFLSLMEL